MKIFSTSIEGLVYWEPEMRQDSRGYFFRALCKDELNKAGVGLGDIVQINQSFSRKKGTFRGMHYQLPPYAEEKVVSCLEGEITDVILDLRKGSASFLKAEMIRLSAENFRSVLIPKGCAHGFITHTEDCRLLYLHTALYNPEFERGVSINDPRLAIRLPETITEMSERDKNHLPLPDHYEGIEL